VWRAYTGRKCGKLTDSTLSSGVDGSSENSSSSYQFGLHPIERFSLLFEPHGTATEECLDKYSANHGAGLEMNLFSVYGVVVVGERDA
jgi:hypothetical protein